MQYQSNAYRVTMIFPKKYPDGSPVLASVWIAMANELRELESDFTEILIRGEWRSEEDDDSGMYFITVPTLERVEELRHFVKRWRSPFKQETMYFDYHPVHFELVN
jgi:hypothetical protein